MATDLMSLPSLLMDNSSGSTTTLDDARLTATPTSVPANTDALEAMRYAVQKVCVPMVVTVGVVGNVLNMVVLTRRCMTNSTNCYLTALAAFDIVYLLASLTLSFQHYDGFDRDTIYVHWFPYGRVLTDMAANISVLLTVTFTVERYIGVCHPMKGRILCTPQRAKIVIGFVAFVAVSCTVPELFEMEVVWKTDPSRGNASYAAYEYTELANTPSYQLGYYWFFVTVFTFLPLVLLCVFNGILISSLFKAAELRTRMTSSSSSSSSSNHVTHSVLSPGRVSERYSREQQWITKMLVTVVLVFILCQLPGAILVLVWAYNELANVRLGPYHRNQLRMAANVTNLLVQINASINFVLYSMTSAKFRRVFWRTLCQGWWCLGWGGDGGPCNKRSFVFSPSPSTPSWLAKKDLALTTIVSGSVRHSGGGGGGGRGGGGRGSGSGSGGGVKAGGWCQRSRGGRHNGRYYLATWTCPDSHSCSTHSNGDLG